MLRRPDAAVAWWPTLKVGQAYALEYQGDEVAHERRALWPCRGSTWVGLTPDGDIYAEDLACPDRASGPARGYLLPRGANP